MQKVEVLVQGDADAFESSGDRDAARNAREMIAAMQAVRGDWLNPDVKELDKLYETGRVIQISQRFECASPLPE
jgi:hypothetical protein